MSLTACSANYREVIGMTERLPAIKLFKASCAAYGTCWTATAPYFSGHYPTKKEAMAAAAKTKAKLERRRRKR